MGENCPRSSPPRSPKDVPSKSAFQEQDSLSPDQCGPRIALAPIPFDANSRLVPNLRTPVSSRKRKQSDVALAGLELPSDNEENIIWTVSPHPTSDAYSQSPGVPLAIQSVYTAAKPAAITTHDPATELLLKYNSTWKSQNSDRTAKAISSSPTVRPNDEIGEPISPMSDATSPARKMRYCRPASLTEPKDAKSVHDRSLLPDVPDTADRDLPSEDFSFESDDVDFEIIDQMVAITQGTPRSRSRSTAINTDCEGLHSVKDDASSDKEFDSFDDDLDEAELAKIMADVERNSQVSTIPKHEESVDLRETRYRRLLVDDVSDAEYIGRDAQLTPEMHILATDQTQHKSVVIVLREDWLETTVHVNDYLNVFGVEEIDGQYIIDNMSGILIINPDVLISSTAVADHFYCQRRAIMELRVRSVTDLSKATVYGTILHEIFQTCMANKTFTIDYMTAVADEIIPQHVEKLFFVEEPLHVAKEHVRQRFDIMKNWADKFVAISSQSARNNERTSPQSTIVDVLNTEEYIWSPMYGLKGSIDLTVVVGLGGDRFTVPLEVKTGRSTKVKSHRAQTILYTLLLADRYDAEILTGILYYLDLSETIDVPVAVREVRGLLIGRNAVAAALTNPQVIVPMSRNLQTCRGCFSKTPCLIFHKALEDGTSESSNLGTLFDEYTEHLGPNEKEFLRHWDRLISLEETMAARTRQEIWLMDGLERESVGRCISSLQIDSVERTSGNEYLNRYIYKFSRSAGSNISTSLTETQISIGDPVVISDNRRHIALALGFLKGINEDQVIVSVEKEFDPNHNMDKLANTSGRRHYRVDKDEFSAGMAMVRDNLVQLLAKEGNQRLRDLIVNLEPPRFENEFPSLPEFAESLNSDQVRALNKVLKASDYALIMGMPGTGKTTTIAHIIKALLACNKTVLLASYTHSAVDNILLKVRDHCSSVLRIGQLSKIHPEVRKFASLQSELPDNFADLREFYFGSQIVATTCLGISNLLFQRRKFDYCIIDEASQVTLPICIGPPRFADKFVLVGDHMQLQPLVRNREARAGGLEVSLFRLLSESQPSAVVTLEHQYRMCEEIMTLSNVLVYDGRLKCGNEEVAMRQLHVPNMADALVRIHRTATSCSQEHCWLARLLDPKSKVVFVDTDMVPAQETKTGDRVQNEVEAALIKQFTEALVLSGVPEQSIGVISVYRAQLKLLSQRLANFPDIEMQTVDRFQGRDKECVIISLVRSNDEQNAGDLLKDWRRLNVTFTRARSKLVIFGSRKTLIVVDMLARFFALLSEKQWVLNAPAQAHLLHPTICDAENEKKGGLRRKATVKGGVVSSRPVLRDILNELR